MLRRIAITVAAVSAAGLLSAVPAAAAVSHDGGHSGMGGFHTAGGFAGFEKTNLGGPYGITTVKGEIGGFEAGGGYAFEGHHSSH
ncbi:hypothetical protein [Streptomyces sp. NPDC008139]|uniref:hypothetical protein n=1 Tax=Streptomyces sp. NPDC008139 TaxID=3364814 RepID=UPI0036E4111F